MLESLKMLLRLTLKSSGLTFHLSTSRCAVTLDYLYQNGLRLPDAAQKRVDGIFCQPDFYYEPRFWVFCDGTPHDEPQVQETDDEQRQAIIANGDEVWVYYYRDKPRRKDSRSA